MLPLELFRFAYDFDLLANAAKPKVIKFKDGWVINGEFGSEEVDRELKRILGEKKLNLVIADPPYGVLKKQDADWDQNITSDNYIGWTKHIQKYLTKGGTAYIWGGVGKPHERVFFDYLRRVEDDTGMLLKDLITWKKKRAYGTPTTYLMVREECAYLINGDKPKIFHIPLLEKERGYAGYNIKYPAKSKFLRRTDVWDDITEKFSGKVHIAEKPTKLAEIMILAHTNKNDIIMDPFAGSGSSGEAALKLGRKFILIERDPKNFHIIIKRLRNLK